MDSINEMFDYIKNLIDYKSFDYFDNVQFNAFDDASIYLKSLFNFENVNFDIFDDISNYLKGLIDFGNIDFEFLNDAFNYLKTYLGYEDDNNNKLDENDIMLDDMYSSAFKAICYTKDEIPKNYLPYGLISDRNKYIDKVSDEIDLKVWSLEIYDDCIKYIKNLDGAETESEWYNDFILFTNLQIAFYNNPDLIKEYGEFKLISDYIKIHIRNLRSYVAKNCQLFIECIIYSLEDYKILNDLSLKIIPELLSCTGSEKSTYRDSSKTNLKLLISKCSKHFNQKILWIFFEHSKSLNKKISTSAGDLTLEYFLNSKRGQLDSLDIRRLIEYLEPGLGGKNVEVKKSFKKIVISLPDRLSEENLTLFILESFKNPFILEIVKKEYPTISRVM